MISQRLGIFLLVCAMSILLVACHPAGSVTDASYENLRNYVVYFEAASDAKVITVSSDAQECDNGAAAKKGCVRFSRGTYGTIRFVLNEDKAGSSCKSDPPADWVIVRVELSPEGDPNTDKGTFPKPPTAWLRKAFTGVDPDNGTVYLSDLSEATELATIIDLNNHVGSKKIAYYQVTASTCGENPRTIQIDPSIQNTGK